ncbi:Hypothetical protein HDN1F_25920 [gamma proteobacterium HdN1]|nr:Hypothetical protein HDN1F_25920 [gamma proteobacterium HdN1]
MSRRIKNKNNILSPLYSLRSFSLPSLVVAMTATFTLTSPLAQAGNYQCKANEPQCVTNFNNNLLITRDGNPKPIKIFRVVSKGKATDMNKLVNNTQHLIRFFRTASRGQFDAEIVGKETIEVEGGSCQAVQNQALRKAKDNAYLNIFALPSSECKGSHAGSNNVWLDGGGLFRTYPHEAGHILGLGHGNTNIRKFDDYADPSTYMGSMPSLNYNAPQLFWLGWTDKGDVVGINSQINYGGEIEVKLRAVNMNIKSDDTSAAPMAYVFDRGELSGKDAPRLFIAMPRSSQGGYGREIFVYRANCTKGCGTTVSGRITMKDKDGKEIDGLHITPVGFNDNFTEVTLRIRKVI